MRNKNFDSSEEKSYELSELMRAIILRAIEDLKQGGELGEDARMFFLEYGVDDPQSHPFSLDRDWSSHCG
ncbi:MAG: hypothetical protein NZO16_07245, partial [Deltaproteobacteria bacterium]|nr:hypothetical protein [Deltaproteobacteria bacterium]